MKIKVTKTHIKNGKPEYCDSCPIALAIKEGLNSEKKCVSVVGRYSGRHGEFPGYCKINRVRYELPNPAMDFIDAFDHRKPVVPFEFEIDYDN